MINLESINVLTRQNLDANKLSKTVQNSILDASQKCNLKKWKHIKQTKTNLGSTKNALR